MNSRYQNGISMTGPGGSWLSTPYTGSSGGTSGIGHPVASSPAVTTARDSAIAVACLVRSKSALNATPLSTQRAKVTMSPNRAGARIHENSGIARYRAEYRPARGPNDAQAAMTASPPYNHSSSARRARAIQAPLRPQTVATTPGNSDSLGRGRYASSQACAYEELVRYALQFAENEPAASSVRPKPARCTRRYGMNTGATRASATAAPTASETPKRLLRHVAPATPATITANATINNTKIP